MGAIERHISNLWRKISLVVSRGKIHSVGDDYRVQSSSLEGETKSQTHMVQHYGFSSRPLNGAKFVGVCAGCRSSMVIIATDDDRYRPSLKDGEVALYDSAKAKIKLNGRGGISIANRTTDLVASFTKVLELLSQATVATDLGPQPLSTRAELEALMQQVKTLVDEG